MTATSGGKDTTWDGKYEVIDEKTIEVSITYMGQTKTEKSTFKVTGDTLELTDSRGKTDRLTKVK
jgi:hypothetical protein